MIAIQHDAQMSFGHLYPEETLFRMAVSLQLYAISKGKKITVDLETKNVILE